MRILVETVLVFLLFFLANQSEAACPVNWKEYKGDCYYISENRFRYTDAEITCSSRNASMYVFHNEKQKQWIDAQLFHGTRMEFWIGLQRVNKTWTWIDNTTYDANSTKWLRNKVGVANDARHRCATMYSYRPYTGQVHQNDCNRGNGIICVKSRDSFELCNRDDGWILIEQKCVKLFEDKSAWLDANRTCTKNNANLYRMINGREVWALGEVVGCRTDDNQMWIDISDVPYPGQWRYSNNMTVRYQPWASSARKILTKGGTCVFANPRQNFYWDVELCTEEKKFVCSKDTGTCPQGWAQFKNECFQLVSISSLKDSWFGAKTYCENQNTKLLTILSSDEEGFVQSMMVSQQVQRAWLGFSDSAAKPDILSWIDGSLVSAGNYTHWDLNYPKLTKNRTDCGIFQAGRIASAWSNGYCFTSLPFICKATITTDVVQKTTPRPDVHCDPGWVLYNGQCYYFGASQNSSGYSWDDAQRFCYAANGDLTTISNANEQAFINKNLLTVSSAWIGLRYRPTQKGLAWVDYTQVVFVNFYPGEPDDLGNGQDCIQIVGGRQDFTGAWDDGNCTKQQDFICKKIASPGFNTLVTLPPTTLGVYSYRCGPQWIYDSLDDYCYQFVLYHPKTFANAQWACQQMGSNLLSITGPREQRYIQAILNTGKYLKVSSNYWIGGSDATQEGGWSWIDGSPFAYLNWHPGEPNERMFSPSGEDCIEMVPNWNYQWNDKRCDKEQYYICKKQALPLTTTALTPTSGPIYTCGNEPMISGNYSLLDGDTSLTASSVRDSGHGPFNSRLYLQTGLNGASSYANTAGWSALKMNKGEYIQAYFYNLITFKGITTAGKPDGSEWVTQYKIQYQYDYFSELVWYEEPPGTIKVFNGNTDNTSPVTNVIQFPFQAKYIRLYPVKWQNAISLRWEVLGCVQEFCISDYAISGPLITTDNGLTASSSLSSTNSPAAARLHPLKPQTVPSCWKPSAADKNWFIQVDLGSIMIIRGITIAGNPNAPEWVTNFRVAYGSNPKLVTSYYQEPYKTIKVFDGNVNNNETVTRYFKGHFQARYIKVEPTAYEKNIALRFDVMVCPQGCNQKTLLSGKTGVNDDQLSASTTQDNFVGPAQSRLNQLAIGNAGGAWSPTYNDQRQWIQVDLQAMIQITAIATQGRTGHDEYVTQYKIASSPDGHSFIMYSAFQRNALVFMGNMDDSTPRKHYLTLPIVARFIRIYPFAYHKKISLRWEVYGCPGPDSGTLIGCYADDKLSRDLSYEPYGDPSVGMWPPMCIHHCFSKGYYYAGLQNRYMCFCGNSYGKYGRSNTCNQPCYTRPSYKCGGITSNSVYTTGLTPVTKVCPPNWKSYNDKCYLLLFNQTSWLNARQDCRIMGGDLATVNSQAEQDLVYSIMSNKGASDVWIGLNDQQEQNFFEWINGEVTMYTNWNVNQPANTNSANENCVMINQTDGGWQDQNCDEPHQYLCMQAKSGSSQPTLPPQSPGCDIGWTGFRWSCYLFMDQTRSFARANQACKARGATLVQIDDRFEQAFLSSSLNSKSGMYWTDATNLVSPGTFKNFDNNKEVLYTNWAPNRPGNARSCVAMQTKTPAGLWIDTSCTVLSGAVCEKLGVGQTTPKPPTTTPAPVPCPKGWIEVNNYCYQVNAVQGSRQMPYRDADKDCRSQGASLASFHNSSDMDTLWRNNLVGSKVNFWIGLNDLTLVNTQRKYKWTDNSPLNFVNWGPNEPNNFHGTEDCTEVLSASGLWNDQNCQYHRNWICKVRKGANVHSRLVNRAPSAGPPGQCVGLINWTFYNNNCYIVMDGSGNNAKTWREARQVCQGYGADLVSIGSMLEQLFVQYQASNISSYTLWTGFSEIDNEFGYKWSDGTVPSYINWNPGEPNDYAGAEDCVELMVFNGKWNDAHCAEKKGFICKQVTGVKPPTTPTPLMTGYCPAGFRAHRNKCYKVFTTLKTWTDANTACQALGGRRKGYYLASIGNVFENAFVTTLLQGSGVEPWIGLKQRSNHQFYWVDNTDLTYTNWDVGQPARPQVGPSGNSAVCTRIYSALHNAGRWSASPCSLKKGYICATNKKIYITTPEAIPNPCPSGYLSYGLDCFQYVPTKATWSAADADCKSRKSFLATLSNPFEQNFLFLMINDPKVRPSKSSVWIGLNDVQLWNSGSYSWTQAGWSVIYTNWGNGQPKRASGGGCVAANISGQWADTACSQALPYVCKSTTGTPPATPPGPNGQCPGPGWISYGPKCYRFYYKTSVSYLDATLNCSRQQASMVSLHSMDQNNFLISTLKSYTVQSEGLWLGFHKSTSAGFQWYDKSTPQFINWDQGQPSGKTQRGNQENCVEIRSWNGKWNDVDCSQTRGYICEKMQVVDTADNSTPGPQKSTVATPTKTPTIVPPTITPPYPGKQTAGIPSRPTGKTPSRQTQKTNSPLPTIPHISPYTGTPQPVQQAPPSKNGLSSGAIIGIIIGLIVALALPTIGIVLWKRRQPHTNQNGTPGGFENSTYQLDTKHETETSGETDS
ncbi:uncharacterized protein [Mytilus edulis]|uniref:uncharacterized protein isoform X1 n=2 Tax=Mytilus edulis TaxID=6550 RepID=UPI0039F11626